MWFSVKNVFFNEIQGNVAAKVVSFYRRRDISNSLTHLADKHANDLAEDMLIDTELSDVEKHQLTHREVHVLIFRWP